MTIINEDVKLLIEISVRVQELASSVEGIKTHLSHQPRNIGERLDSIYAEFIDIRHKIDDSVKLIEDKQAEENRRFNRVIDRLSLDLIANNRLITFGIVCLYSLLVSWIMISITTDFDKAKSPVAAKIDSFTENKLEEYIK